MRTKSFAANIDQIVMFLGAEPEFSDMQLTRALIAAQAERIKVIIVLNKYDLTDFIQQVVGALSALSRHGCHRIAPVT